jgi:hypothetical protein
MVRRGINEEAPRPARRREPQMLGSAFLFLAALFIISLVVALLWADNETVDRFVPNLTSEVLGIIITLAFVQRLLQRQERARRMRASIGAFRRGGRALSRLLRTWADVLKGCHGRGPAAPAAPYLRAAHHRTARAAGRAAAAPRRGGDERWVAWLLREVDARWPS